MTVVPISNAPLRVYFDPVLRLRCDPVTEVEGATQDLILAMAETMYRCEGVGLAAPQLGVSKRVIVADVGDGLLAVINPVIEERSGMDRMVEGYLSLPGIQVEVERSRRIVLSGWSGKGEERSLECTELLARVVQHEIDHLDGVLIVDHAPAAERAFLRRTMKKLQRLNKRDEVRGMPQRERL